MARAGVRDWMWSEAVDMLSRADRLHQQFFRPQAGRRAPSWEPPVDVLETEQAVVVLAALPGVGPGDVQAVIDDGVLIISGVRGFPTDLRTAAIHRLELPQGRFERRIPLPLGRYDKVRQTSSNGCLIVSLRKAPSNGDAP
jgi:HSP20 family molecular chaperone IbpA